jgi:hypothetical protein
LAHGCGYAAWGNQLELEEYSIITALCNHPTDEKCQYAVKQFILWSVLPRVWKLQELYNYPDTYEQWMDRQYPKVQSIMEDKHINLPD